MKAGIVCAILGLTALFVGGCIKEENSDKEKKPAVAQKVPKEMFSLSQPAAIAGKAVSSGGKGIVDFVNGKALPSTNTAKVAKSEGLLLMEGWALDDDAKRVPETVIIELKAKSGGATYYAPASRKSRKRPDVAEHFNNPKYETGGFTLSGDIQSVPPGQYAVIIIMVDGDKVQTNSVGVFVEVE